MLIEENATALKLGASDPGSYECTTSSMLLRTYFFVVESMLMRLR